MRWSARYLPVLDRVYILKQLMGTWLMLVTTTAAQQLARTMTIASTTRGNRPLWVSYLGGLAMLKGVSTEPIRLLGPKTKLVSVLNIRVPTRRGKKTIDWMKSPVYTACSSKSSVKVRMKTETLMMKRSSSAPTNVCRNNLLTMTPGQPVRFMNPTGFVLVYRRRST